MARKRPTHELALLTDALIESERDPELWHWSDPLRMTRRLSYSGWLVYHWHLLYAQPHA